MAEPTIQLGGGNWAGKSGNLLGYYEQNKKFYAEDFTFSRSTTGTYTDSDGYIQEMPYNLFEYSEDFSQNFWLQTYNGIIPTSTTTAPNGTKTAQKYSETTTPYNLIRPQTNILGTDYTLSIYVKNVDADNFYVRTNSGFSYYNFSNGTTSNTNLTATDVGNGWILLVTNSPNATWKQFGIGESESDSTEANNSVYVWGAQLVKGTSAKTYFPTTTRLNMPRVDYLNNSNGSLILEPQRTNLVTHSSDFSGGWALDDATKVSNSTASPDGTVNAITLIGNTNASRHHISKVAAGSVTASLSVFAKAKELRYLQIASANITSQYVNFDVSDGTIGTVGSSFTDAKIEDYGNGWYRCSVTSTNQYNSMYISLVSSLTSSWLESWTMSNNTDGLYLYGAQVEQGDYATSYIPTSGSTVTRTADVCDNAGTSATFNDAEGVLFAEIAALANDGTNRTISISDGTNTNQIVLRFSSTANQITAYITDGGVITAELTHTLTNALNYNKIGLKYKLNDVGLWVNGTEVATDTSATMPSGFDELKFSRADGANDFYGKCKQLMVFDEALSDSELQALTS